MAKYVLCSFGALAFAMAVIGAASAIAGEEKLRPVDSAECKEITARVIEATGATFGEYSLLGDNVFLNHTLVPDRMVLSCGIYSSSPLTDQSNHYFTGISVSFEGAFPPNPWFAVAAKAGRAVTGEEIRTLDQGIRQCHREALESKTELAELETPHAKIECQAFTRDGGGVTMTVWVADEEARKFEK